jgi:transcriptional regulator of acetoin/glycerol metabolism
MTAAGTFRADLLARLSGYATTLPTLHERREDLAILVASLLARIAPNRPVRFTSQAARALFHYDWPLNIRELEKSLEVAVALAADKAIDLQHLPAKIRPSSNWPKRPVLTDEARRDQLVALLQEHDYNVSAVARAMGKARMQVQRWMRRYKIRAPT